MATPNSPRGAEWQQGHIPRLAYRNAAPLDQRPPSPEERVSPISDSPPLSPTVPRQSISQIRQSIPEQRRASVPGSISVAPKKKSMFGGLFSTKEPTRDALNQVAAQLIAQHGSISPKAVPNVRQEKMPASVPKVNSKWDGIPDSVKLRERDEKARAKAAKHQSLTFSNLRPSSDTGPSHILGRRSSNSTSASTGTQESKASLRPSTTGHYSSETAVDLPSPAPSSSGLPEISCYFLNDTQTPSTLPSTAGIEAVAVRDMARPSQAAAVLSLPASETLPEHTRSSVTTSNELSPTTPIDSRIKILAQPQAVVLPATDTVGPALGKKQKAAAAFLAGEAQELQVPEDAIEVNVDLFAGKAVPLQRDNSSITALKKQDIERRPDSSRERLGLRASLVLRSDVLPWEAQDGTDASSSQSTSLPIRSISKAGTVKSKIPR